MDAKKCYQSNTDMDMLKHTHTHQVLKSHTREHKHIWKTWWARQLCGGKSMHNHMWYMRGNNSYERTQKYMSQGCRKQGEDGHRHGPKRPHLHNKKYHNRVNKTYWQQKRNVQAQVFTEELMFREAPMLERKKIHMDAQRETVQHSRYISTWHYNSRILCSWRFIGLVCQLCGEEGRLKHSDWLKVYLRLLVFSGNSTSESVSHMNFVISPYKNEVSPPLLVSFLNCRILISSLLQIGWWICYTYTLGFEASLLLCPCFNSSHWIVAVDFLTGWWFRGN